VAAQSNDGGLTQGTNATLDAWANPLNTSFPPKYAISTAAGASSGSFNIADGFVLAFLERPRATLAFYPYVITPLHYL